VHSRGFLDKPPREPALAIVVAAELAHVHGRHAIGITDKRCSFDGGEKTLVFGISTAIVNEPSEQRSLLGAMAYAAAGHADLLVPRKQVETGREDGFIA